VYSGVGGLEDDELVDLGEWLFRAVGLTPASDLYSIITWRREETW